MELVRIGLAMQRADLVAIGVATMTSESVPKQWLLVRGTLSEAYFDLDLISEQDSILRFRFLPSDINNLVVAFKLPPVIQLPSEWNGYSIISRDALALMMERLAHPITFHQLAALHGGGIARLCDIFNYLLLLIERKVEMILAFDVDRIAPHLQ